ncbi:MAG: polyribonucleotide nucleotidyltransferase [Alphaproteobacteria bacterium]
MFNIHRKEIMWGGRPLVLETGKIARQADGAVLATYGETQVLATVVGEKEAKPGIDFFPLSVHYQEKTYAAGRIPGGFFKREGRPSEHETLTSRLIDRPIRPLFAKGYKNETQILITVLSHDMENAPDILSLVAASAALTISGLPFLGPIGGARVGYIDGEFVLNPKLEQMDDSQLDLVVAGTTEGVLMVESEASELTEETMLAAVDFGHKAFQPVIDLIISLAEECAKDPREIEAEPKGVDALKKEVKKLAQKGIKAAYKIQKKQDRMDAVSAAKSEATEAILASEKFDEEALAYLPEILKGLEKDIVRGDILKTGKRIDGRDTKTVRPIVCETGLLTRAHGSALFTRGETQALVVTTLGTGQDEQFVDSLEGETKSKFMLHYNFPPYSVGETGRIGATGRREVGHGKLAYRAIYPVLPKGEDNPYTIRVVSEVTESNGSSSMATVCGTSMSLMDAGVQLPKPVAGIAMGLIKEGDEFAVLSDIMGDEDHLGDMDFKVAGTQDGITALQMDIKITSVTPEIMQIALTQAKEGRKHILGEMAKAITSANTDVSEFAPRIETVMIHPDKIRDVIGSGGKVIREIVETTGAKIDIEEDGTVKIAAADKNAIDAAVKWVKDITDDPEVGKIYEGKAVKIMEFGAFVNYMGTRDGLVHISELAEGKTEKTEDVVKEGDIVKVKLINIDGRGKASLSMRLVNQETGEDLSDQLDPPRTVEKKERKPRRRPSKD